MPYVPNPTQATEPVESREVLTAAREFRELKGSVNTRIAALTAADATLQSNIDAEAATRAAADSGLNVRTTALEQLAFNGGTPGAVVTKQFTATASQTTFVLDFAPISVAQVSVYLQGIYQHRDTFSVSGANVVLSTGVEAGTLVEITANVPLLLGETSADLVEYLPAGTGAVATDVQSKLRESISTSGYASFTASVTAASNKVLIVNTSVVVDADLTIPASVFVRVEFPGQITVNPSKTLIIAGQFEAGAFRVFYGAGSVVFGTTSRSVSPKIWFGTPGAVFNTSRRLLQSPTEVGGPVHAYEDDNILNFTNPTAPNYNAYASFDAQTQITGTAGYDHYVGFQARATYSGSGSIWDRLDQFNSYPTISGGGTVANLRHFRAENPGGLSGVVSFQAGFFAEKLVRGTENWGFFIKTPTNTVRTAAGEAAGVILQGNGQVGGFGFLLQSRSNSNGLLLNTASAPIEIGTNNTVRDIITADGRWKIGTLTDLASASTKLDINGTNGMCVKVTGAAGNACYLNWHAATTGDNFFQGFYTETGIVFRGSIDYNRASSVVRYNTSSDATLKNIIGDAPRQKSLDILAATRLREYSWKNDGDNKRQIGVIAQEVHEVFPGSVSVGGEYTETDADGNEVTKYRPWAVDKTAWTFHLVAGYQHLKAENVALSAALESLAARVAALETQAI